MAGEKSKIIDSGQRDNPEIVVAQIARSGVIAAAIITLIGVIIGAVLEFPPVSKLFPSEETPSFTPNSIVTLTPLPAATPEVTMTLAPVPITDTPLAISPSPAPPGFKLIVRLYANMTTGRAPLPVTFDASDSFMESDDGTVWPCSQTHLCTYVWSVYKGGKQLGNPLQGQGKYSYKFTQRGTYFVTVYVCRGDVCSGNGITIVAK